MQRFTFGLFSELHYPPRLVNLHEPKSRGLLLATGKGRDGDVGTRLAVSMDEVLVVATVQVVTCIGRRAALSKGTAAVTYLASIMSLGTVGGKSSNTKTL